jgi:hypothetical protein
VYPTGGQGVVLGAYAAPRLLLFHGGHLFAGNNGSVSVFAVNGDGTLSLHPDSPFVSPLPPGPPPDPPVSPPFAPSLAADPSGEWLYAILDGVTAVRFAVADDGRLTYDAAFASGAHYPATSLAVHPSGRWMAGAFGPNGIRLWDAQAPGGPIQTIATASGLTWDAAGRRLFAGAGSLTAVRVRVFRFEGAACTSNLVISCPASVAVECTGPTTPVTSQATCSDACGPCSAACAEIQAPVGTTPVACLATSAGGVAGCTVPATVVDTKPPAIAVSASPSVLWPPDGKLIPIDLAVTVRDLCDVAPRVACRVASSEGDVDGDAVWSEGRLSLRARRAGFSPGRVYTVSCTATDVSGNSAVGQAVVLVPHDARP